VEIVEIPGTVFSWAASSIRNSSRAAGATPLFVNFIKSELRESG